MIEALTIYQLMFTAASIIIAYVVRGITGFGSGLFAIPLLALLLPLTIVVPMITLLDYIASISRSTQLRSDILWHDLWPLLPFTLSGIIAGLYIINSIDAIILQKSLGIFIILYALNNVLSIKPKAIYSRMWAIPIGGFGGFFGAVFGTGGGAFYVIYLMLRGLKKIQYQAMISCIFVIDGGVRLSGYLALGFYNLNTLTPVAFGIPLMAIGMYIGSHIQMNIRIEIFNFTINTLLTIVGIALLLK